MGLYVLIYYATKYCCALIKEINLFLEHLAFFIKRFAETFHRLNSAYCLYITPSKINCAFIFKFLCVVLQYLYLKRHSFLLNIYALDYFLFGNFVYLTMFKIFIYEGIKIFGLLYRLIKFLSNSKIWYTKESETANGYGTSFCTRVREYIVFKRQSLW